MLHRIIINDQFKVTNQYLIRREKINYSKKYYNNYSYILS